MHLSISGTVNNIKIICSIRFSLFITIDRFYKLFFAKGAFVNRRPEMISPLFFIPLPPSNLRPFGAPPSIGRREKSQCLSLEGKCVSNRWKMRVPLSPYCHFERSEKSSLHTGQTKEVRGAVNTVLYTTWNDGLPHRYCFPACKKDRGLRSG